MQICSYHDYYYHYLERGLESSFGTFCDGQRKFDRILLTRQEFRPHLVMLRFSFEIESNLKASLPLPLAVDFCFVRGGWKVRGG